MTEQSYNVLKQYIERLTKKIEQMESEPTDSIEDYYSHLTIIRKCKLQIAAIKRDVMTYEYEQERRKEAKND